MTYFVNLTTFTSIPTAKHLATTTLPTMDCIWGQWVNDACSATCDGTGTQTRTRTNNSENNNQVNKCTGPYEETIQCTVTGTPCPGLISSLIIHWSLAQASLFHFLSGDCIWGDWINGSCSATCDGVGFLSRYRSLQSGYQGNECTGPYQETIECTVTGTPCPGQT